jgi:hypothetical protein
MANPGRRRTAALGRWSPHGDAPVFKVSFEEREVLVEAEPGTFSFTPHYKSSPLVLVHPEKLDLDWARADLMRVWRAQAPRRVIKAAYDTAHEAKLQTAGRASDEAAKLEPPRKPTASRRRRP